MPQGLQDIKRRLERELEIYTNNRATFRRRMDSWLNEPRFKDDAVKAMVEAERCFQVSAQLRVAIDAIDAAIKRTLSSTG